MILSNDNKYRGNLGSTLKLDEYSHVEKPFLEQLAGLGWDVLELQMQQQPEQSFRTSFSEVVLKPKLREALVKINPFLTDAQVDELERKITTFQKNSLLENNQQVLHYLLENTTVSKNEQTGELSPTVRFIDFDNLENNSFVAISQFKVVVTGTDHHIIPDIVLFVNGLPLVVVEAKSSKVKEPIPEAIDQLMRYSEQRGDTGEGNKELFFYNQFLVTTCRTEAKFGTITTQIEKHFYRWTDPYPKTLNDLAHGKSSPNDQQRLVAGMLERRNLLDIIRVFTVFSTNDKGQKIKIVGRYQQFRAVKIATQRLIEGKSPEERGGIIWHTQGSGKSLTMMFMVREMKLRPELMSWKIIFVTDRTQLEEQLSETGQSIGFTIKTANFINPKNPPNGKSLKELLSNDNSDLVMAMIHKFQENGDLTGLEIFPELNKSSNILVMTDEAHRSQYSLLAANLDRAMPNATSIGFTGTPTSKTEKKYKDYIDKYTMRQAIDDGVTLEIVYEGFTHNAEVEDQKGMDDKFADVFSDYQLTERLQILGFGSRDAYLDSMNTIKEKAKSMVDHYVEHIFSGGFKAQIVANSRIAAVRYKAAIDEALKNKIAELLVDNPMLVNIEVLQNLETAVVISGSHNDELEVKAFTNSDYHKKSIKRFKLPFGKTDEEDKTINGNVGIVIVNNMLLTGFDAPIEQVMYLDRVIVAHNLLQTIARVNRVGPEGKDKGFVVDYVGVGHHLKRALDVYADKELQEIIDCISDGDAELNELIKAHQDIWNFLKVYGLEDLSDSDAFFDVFYDEDIRFEYIKLYNTLTSCFNTVLPRKEALEFFNDWKAFTEINALANKHFRDGRFSMKGIPPKLRAIADEYLISKGIEQQVAPISIIADDFFSKVVTNKKREKTKAAEVEHAIRHFIDLNIDEDPELFASFAKALEEILQNFKGNWKVIYEELEKLREKIKNREKEETYGLDRKKQMPFFRIFKAELFDNRELSEDEIARNVNLTQHIFNLIATEIKLTGFWDSTPAQLKLKAELQKMLLSPEFKDLPNIITKRNEIISRLMELAKTNHFKIVND
jgi:type I restriction enzyme R subunit